MKLKKMLMGLALAGLTAMIPSMAAAQSGPYYLAPKLLYSHTMTDDFETSTVSTGGHMSTFYRGKDGSDNAFGGGLAVGYDFGLMGYSPVRLEVEFLARGESESNYPTALTGFANLYDDTVYLPDNRSTFESISLKNKIYTVFANAYWDFTNDSVLTPYIGGGLGMAYIDSKYSSTITFRDVNGLVPDQSQVMGGSQNVWNFAWNVSAGVAWQIRDNMSLDFSYRYSDFGEIDAGPENGWRLNRQVDHPNQATNPNELISSPEWINTKAKGNLTAHEAIVALRITGY